MAVEVLRIIRYRYETQEQADEDQLRWTMRRWSPKFQMDSIALLPKSNAELDVSLVEVRDFISWPGITKHSDFLEFIAGRLVNVHGESENVDYVLSLRERAARFREYGG